MKARLAPAALAVLLSALTACSTMDTLVQKASGAAAEKGYISGSQASAIQKSSTAFRKSGEDFSESEEYFIGRSVAAQILSRYQPLQDDVVNHYVQTVLQAVAMSSDRPAIFKGYHAQVLDTDEVNAFATPGGFIFITKGLLKRVQSEDQLAAVLGHELAHVSLKHGLKTIQTARLTSAFTILGTEAAKTYAPDQVAKLTEAFEGSIDDIVNKLVVNGYSRDKELEADRTGAVFAQRANYNPKALPDFIAGLKDLPTASGLGKTHPGADVRLAALSKVDLRPSGDYRPSQARTNRFLASIHPVE